MRPTAELCLPAGPWRSWMRLPRARVTGPRGQSLLKILRKQGIRMLGQRTFCGVIRWLKQDEIEYVDFNNCVYADPVAGERLYKKLQRIVGKLKGLSSLSATCRCKKGTRHPKNQGSVASKESAAYPSALCRAYAIAGSGSVVARASGEEAHGDERGHPGGRVGRRLRQV